MDLMGPKGYGSGRTSSSAVDIVRQPTSRHESVLFEVFTDVSDNDGLRISADATGCDLGRGR